MSILDLSWLITGAVLIALAVWFIHVLKGNDEK